MLNGKPVIKVTNGFRTQVGLLCQPDPCDEVDGQDHLSVVLEDHLLSADFLLAVSNEDTLDEVRHSFLDLFLSQLEYVLHL